MPRVRVANFNNLRPNAIGNDIIEDNVPGIYPPLPYLTLSGKYCTMNVYNTEFLDKTIILTVDEKLYLNMFTEISRTYPSLSVDAKKFILEMTPEKYDDMTKCLRFSKSVSKMLKTTVVNQVIQIIIDPVLYYRLKYKNL